MTGKKKITKSKILSKNINKNINKINIKIGDTSTKKKTKRTYKKQTKKPFINPVSSNIINISPQEQPKNYEYERKLIKLLEQNTIKPSLNKVSDKKTVDNVLINDLIEEAKRPETKEEYIVDKGTTDINVNEMPRWATESPINKKLPFGSPSDYEVLEQSEKSDNSLTDLVSRNNKGERNDFSTIPNLNETEQDIEDDVATVDYDYEHTPASVDNPKYGYYQSGKIRRNPTKKQIKKFEETGKYL